MHNCHAQTKILMGGQASPILTPLALPVHRNVLGMWEEGEEPGQEERSVGASSWRCTDGHSECFQVEGLAPLHVAPFPTSGSYVQERSTGERVDVFQPLLRQPPATTQALHLCSRRHHRRCHRPHHVLSVRDGRI